MTVYQNMAFALKMRKFPKPQICKRVEETASLLGIEHLLSRKPRALSGGQCQRVALGRAIVRSPQAFLFDEPLSNLDAQLRASTRVELKALHNKLQATSIYVTHDQAEAMTLGDRVCVMRNGAVQQVGAPMEVYEKPVNRFTAGFIGTPPMNFFAGRVEFRNDTACFAFANSSIKLPLHLKAVLANYRDKEMVLGIRPEHLSFHPLHGQTDNSITATVNAVEQLGTRTDVYLTSNDDTGVVASIGTHPAHAPGDTIRMYIDLEKIHVFDSGEMGKNVILCK
jgi:multiple sugar transport system ATP-binding protein